MPLKLGDRNPAVRRWRHVMNLRFGGYARALGPLPDDTDEFGPRAQAWQQEYERRTLQLVDGVVSDGDLQELGVVTPPRYPIQGVGGDSRAYLMPPDAPSFQRDVQNFGAEGHRLHSVLRANGPASIVPIGYSMGGTSVKRFLDTVPPEWRDDIKMVVTFGDPSMPAEGSLLGNPPGEGISKEPQPQWCWDRYYSYSLDGDWYPRARGLLFILYQVISRAELTLEFASWLVTVFPTRAMQELFGAAPSADPLAGVLRGLGTAMSTGGSQQVGFALDPIRVLMLLPQLVQLLVDAIKFAASNAHGLYGDPAHAEFDGLTAVDHAVRTIRERVPNATLLLFPGSWATWDQGFPMDVALRLQSA